MDEKFCPSCGMKLDDFAGKFCPGCGAKIETASVEPNTETDFQPMASTDSVPVVNPPVGTVNVDAGQPQPQNPVTSVPQIDPAPAAMANQVYAQQAPVTNTVNTAPAFSASPEPGTFNRFETQQPAQQPKKKNTTAVIIAVAVAAAVVLGVLLFLILKPRYIEKITFDEESILVDVNDKYDIKYTAEPSNYKGDELTWKSSDEDVAKVKDGKITPVAEGTCTITVKSKNVTEKIEVEVQVLPTDITFTSQPDDLYIDDTISITVKIEPADVTDDTITWSSSDESVATVDEDGIITGVSEGTCTITAETVNGLKAESKITVKKEKYIELITGNFSLTEIYDYDDDTSYTPGADEHITFTVNEDGTAVANWDEDTINFTWEFTYIDDSGDYKYKFTNSNGGTFTAYIMQDSDYPQTIGQFWFVLDSGIIQCEKAD